MQNGHYRAAFPGYSSQPSSPIIRQYGESSNNEEMLRNQNFQMPILFNPSRLVPDFAPHMISNKHVTIIPNSHRRVSVDPYNKHRGVLTASEKFEYDLSHAQLKATSRTSALLAGFAMIALVELQYNAGTPHHLLIILGIITTLLVSVHLVALMMSTCLLPHIQASGSTQDSPHGRLHFYIELSWRFSTCIGLLLFLLEVGVIFIVKYEAIGFMFGAYLTTAILVPVFIIFLVISCLIHRHQLSHSLDRLKAKFIGDLDNIVDAHENSHQTSRIGLIQHV